ncbi:MAG: zinc ribbon domain-containing protein, partial [Ktedonobacteraceae bacterium]|nr:zinc ribbon domain-containing protein [Ktedonobacteraceae bacterium]
MANCSRCGSDITGKKFCPQCGTAVARPTSTCPHCNGEITPGAAFCMHCGTSLNAPHAQMAPPPPPVNQTCPACQATIPTATTFCTNCGHDMRTPAPQITGAQTSCASC